MEEIIKKYHFKDGLNHEFEILDLATILRTKKDMMTIPHRAQFYHIVWIEKGEGTHYVDFKPINIENNSIIFVPQNGINTFDPNGQYEGKAILFTDGFFCKNKEDNQYLHSSILFSDLYDVGIIKFDPHLPDLSAIFNSMQTEFLREPDTAQFQILHNLMHVFLLKAERELKKQGFEELKPSANLDYLLLFKDQLEQNFRTEKSVKKYAAEVCISEKQLHKATTTLLAKTPKQIIDERVLLEAKRLLVHGNQSIKEIAYELGYEEPTNFVKYFKKRTNTTPSEFREQN